MSVQENPALLALERAARIQVSLFRKVSSSASLARKSLTRSAAMLLVEPGRATTGDTRPLVKPFIAGDFAL